MKEMNISKRTFDWTHPHITHGGGNTLTVIGSTSIIEPNGKSVNTKIHFAAGVKTFYLLFNVCKKRNLLHQNTTKMQTATSVVLLLQYCYLLHLYYLLRNAVYCNSLMSDKN